ncbi:MAG: DUF4178 domain-containing protein [Pseudomonadota bacterium]
MVSAVDQERFGLNAGRARPPYQPKNIRCSGCGAGLTVKNEHSEMVVCDYCGSRLDISAEEQTVLGKNPDRAVSFPLQLGDSFYHRATRFEVLARLAFIEDDDSSDMTREYLLYNPRMGTLWLGEYDGEYSLTCDSHVLPKQVPFSVAKGDVIDTHDGRQWVAEGVGTYELYYVDGALPWIASVGDRIEYAEFAEKSGSGRIYEAQSIETEMEYGEGRRLPLAMVRRATKKAELGKEAVSPADRPDAAVIRKWYMRMMMVALACLVFNGALAAFCYTRGTWVLRQSFPAAEVSEGVITNPFRISGGGTIQRIEFSAPLDNAWMELDAQVVRDEDLVVQPYLAGISYYHGYEDGEGWSEGSQSESFMVMIPQAGDYRIHVQAVSARGNTEQADAALHDLRVRVYDRVQPWIPFALAAVVCFVLLVLTFIFWSRWRKGDDDDDDDDDD